MLKEKGYTGIIGPKPFNEQSFQDGYISDGNGWSRMHKNRNLTSHTYDEETAEEIIEHIRTEYIQLLGDLKEKLSKE